MQRIFPVLALAFLSPACGGGGGDSSGAGGAGGTRTLGSGGAVETPWGEACAPLPAAAGNVISVGPGQADDLPGIVRDAAAGATIELGDGTYVISGAGETTRRIQIAREGITLKSKSGNRDAVILDGQYETEEIVTISASQVTLADLTLYRAVHHAVHVTGGPTGDVTGTVLHNIQIVDSGQQFVKVNSSGATPNTYADYGVVECSFLELSEPGRLHVAPEPGGCYTGGIDAHQARGWRVHKNIFRSIHCKNGSLAEHAVHFWTASRDTLVEDNVIIDCARGIGFGLGDGAGAEPERAYLDDPYADTGYVGHYDGVIRNNMIASTTGLEFFDTGIELEQARGARVLHNTVLHPGTGFASISHRFANSRVVLENNMVQSIRARDESEASGTSNLTNVEPTLFVNPAGHDLHLVSGAALAIGKAVVLPDSGNDIDGDVRDTAPDLGADEFTAP